MPAAATAVPTGRHAMRAALRAGPGANRPAAAVVLENARIAVPWGLVPAPGDAMPPCSLPRIVPMRRSRCLPQADAVRAAGARGQPPRPESRRPPPVPPPRPQQGQEAVGGHPACGVQPGPAPVKPATALRHPESAGADDRGRASDVHLPGTIACPARPATWVTVWARRLRSGNPCRRGPGPVHDTQMQPTPMLNNRNSTAAQTLSRR